jgi:hypothetical protein
MIRLLLKLLPEGIRTRRARRIAKAFLGVNPDLVVSLILEKIEETYDINKGKNYKSAEEEVDMELEKIPEFKPYRIYLVNTVRNLRIKHGLGG